jgi:hypothetical protein
LKETDSCSSIDFEATDSSEARDFETICSCSTLDFETTDSSEARESCSSSDFEAIESSEARELEAKDSSWEEIMKQ